MLILFVSKTLSISSIALFALGPGMLVVTTGLAGSFAKNLASVA